MTRKECEEKLKQREAQRDELIDAIASLDVQSATHSAGGGSDSYTNRTIDDMEKKLRRVQLEIAKLEARLGLRAHPNKIKTIVTRYR